MLDKQVDGIIATGKRVDRSLPVDLSGLPVPVVYAFTSGPADSITYASDDVHGAKEAVAHLLSLGRKRLVHITGPDSFIAALERAEAFRSMAGPNAPVLHGYWTESWGREAVLDIWRTGERLDGIFCGNDMIARGVIDGLRELGVSVPDDVSVIGFDNWEIVASQSRPPLTTIDMNLKELGRQAGLTCWRWEKVSNWSRLTQVAVHAGGALFLRGIRLIENKVSGLRRARLGGSDMRNCLPQQRLLQCCSRLPAWADTVQMWVRSGVGDAFTETVKAFNAGHKDKIETDGSAVL